MFLYILAVSGIMVHAHYCGEVLESWTVYLKAAGCDDGDCGDESDEPDGCCEDKVIAYKVTNDQYQVDAFKIKLQALQIEALATNDYYLVLRSSFDSQRAVRTYQSNAPPGLWENIPLFKLHSSFNYYG
jgi:hypothetical protein